MNHPHQKTIVFDLDGTLVHSAPDLVTALNMTIEPLGLAPMKVEDIGYLAGQGAMAMLEKAMKAQKKNIGEEEKNELFNQFIQNYQDHIADETQFFEGCIDALEKLENNNFILAICTNKREELAILLMEKLKEKNRFKCLTGGDSYQFKKPDARHVIETIKLAGGDINKAIMVGDSINDIKAAKDGGVAAIAVSFGYSEIDINTMGADVVIHHFSELVKAVEKIESKWN